MRGTIVGRILRPRLLSVVLRTLVVRFGDVEGVARVVTLMMHWANRRWLSELRMV